MRRHQYVALSLVLGFTPAGLAPAALAQGICEFDEIVLFATNSIDLNTGSDVLSGDVVVNAVATGPTIGSVELEVGQRVIAASGFTLKAPNVVVKKFAVVGDVVYDDLLDNKGTITGSETGGVAPPYTSAPVFQQAVLREEAEDSRCSVTTSQVCTVDADCPSGETCEPPPPGTGEDVDVPDFGFAELPAGDYGDILVGGDATVLLSGGLYNVRSIDGGGDSMILFAGPSDVRIDATFLTANNSVVGPSGSCSVTSQVCSVDADCPAAETCEPPPSASEIVLFVGGENDASDPQTFPFAAKVGNFSDVDVNFYVPNGTLRIKRGSLATGAFLAKDVHIERDVQLSLESAFVNQAPTAIAQEALTDGANAVLITLEGSDPEGEDLSFSIEVGPAEGTLDTPSPIIPGAVDQCSQSGEACAVDADCSGFAEGETCETVQPPITQATVTYTPNLNNNCVTEPESGEVTCPEDFFTFGVTDDCGDLGTAIVSINGGTDEVPDDPGPGVDLVEANDSELDAVVSQLRVITLSAAAPDTVASLTFRVETLSTGALQDSDGFAVVAAVDLPSPVVTYQAPATAGSDSFTFSARDSSTTAPPCGPPSCDTGTVNIDIGNLPELAPDQSVGTDLNQPVEITLRANAGGTTGAPPPPLSSLVTEVTYDDNGPQPGWDTLVRLAAQRGFSNGLGIAMPPGPLSLTALGVDQGWQQFSWCDEATVGVGNCFTGALVDLVNESPAIEGPFDFSITETSCMRVSDVLAKGDHWRVENQVGGNLDWTDFTSEVDQSTVGTTSDPDVAFGDLSYSHGEFDLSGACVDVAGEPIPCAHSIRLITIPPDSIAWGTTAYIRVDTGPCVDIVWTITSLPMNGTLTNPDGSAVQIGDTYLSTPLVIYTPTLNVSGPDTFAYQVTESGTFNTGVVDAAIVDLLVSTTDPCVEVGRPPGCTP